jgi:hypothetical protein
MLLYAQPVTRIVRLTLDDLAHQDGELFLRLGDPPTPVPEPFATLLLQLADNRPHLNTATNTGARWLLSGGRAGQPANPSTVREHLRLAGFSTSTARPAALRQLVLQVPAPSSPNPRLPPPHHHTHRRRCRRHLEPLRPNDHSE